MSGTHLAAKMIKAYPSRRERGNVDANKGDERLLSTLVAGADRDADDGNEVLANAHHHRTPDEERATTKALNTPHAGNGHADVHHVGCYCDEEGVRDTGVFEEGCALFAVCQQACL